MLFLSSLRDRLKLVLARITEVLYKTIMQYE